MAQILSGQDIASISIFKSKNEYYELKNEIEKSQTRILKTNWVWLVVFGILGFLSAIVDTITA